MSRLSLFIACSCWLLCSAAAAEKARAPAADQWLITAIHHPTQPRPGDAVKVTIQVKPGVKNLALLYQIVEPGAYIELKDRSYQSNWLAVVMQPEKSPGNNAAFTATLAGELQKPRRLIRYRFTAVDASGQPLMTPNPDSPTPNFAWFVYDGIPAWAAAINPKSSSPQQRSNLNFSAEAMRRVQAYHLIGKKTSIENVTWNEQDGGKEYKYTGSLVVDGMVCDHIRYRARGGVWRFAMGKNMWKFDLPSGQRFPARDDFGQVYPVPWGKVNLRACIQQGDYGQRGEQGMFEAVGFRLFRLAGVPAPHTHWIQLRIVDEAEETPANQYRGDFWGLYLAIENEDGTFLKTHGLPDGNLYKMFGGDGELSHQGAGAVTNRSDLHRFITASYSGNLADAWWRTNLDLAGYYSYRAICECIHHYDIADGKNYDYYHNPATGQWQVIPWDIDLTWADHMYGSGEEPFKRRVLARPVFRLEYQNRLREIRDLLFNPEQAGQMIDEYAAVIWDPTGAPSLVEADRRKWDYHPMMAMGGKAGQGLFYQSSPTRDFPGMAQVMKNYVKSRAAWIDNVLLKDAQIPVTPAVTYAGPTNFPVEKLRFRASPYQGAGEFAAMKWRLAEITPARAPRLQTAASSVPRLYEIIAVWESHELNTAGEVAIPAGIAKPGHTYRARVRMKDLTGRWSHWSPPAEFVAGK